MKQLPGLGLYSVTTCTGDILWRFTKITASGTRLYYSHHKQYTCAITKKQKWSILHWVTLPLPQSIWYHGTIFRKKNAWRWICNCPISPWWFKMSWRQIGVRPPATTILTTRYIMATSNDLYGVSKYRSMFVQQFFFLNWQQKHQSSALLSLYEENPLWPVGFPAQRDSNVENVSIW